jgi:xanthine dehydrogenase small subunit
MPTRPLRFLRRGKAVTLHGVPADRTLLDLLREDLRCTGTKEGCGEGDCGACTVVIGERIAPGAAPVPGAASVDAENSALADGAGARMSWRAINSCIRLAHSIDGMSLWTVEDLAGADGALHPAQQALVDCHASQCGFCTPGFAMSLFAMYQNRVRRGRSIDRATAQEELSGNLCRCTGYRPILDAAQRMADLPAAAIDEAEVLSKLERLAQSGRGPESDSTTDGGRWPAPHPATDRSPAADPSAFPAYRAPTRLDELLRARAERPAAQLVAGCTDVGLWVTKQHRRFAEVLDVTRAEELRRIDRAADGALRIGAAATLQDAFAALVDGRPTLREFAARFAGLPVRNSGTLGGNVANGSPIGDSMPMLIALGARVVLASVRGERALPLENLYTGYRQNVLAPDELLAWIEVPAPAPDEFLRVHKVSKRFDDDISAVCLAVRLVLRDGAVAVASIGAGGVAAVPARARGAEAALAGRPWTAEAARAAGAALQAEFQPISDMRASGAYRRTLLANLMTRCWLESQGLAQVSLATLAIPDDAPEAA